MNEDVKELNKIFRVLAIVFLALLIIEIPVLTVARKIAMDSYYEAVDSNENVSTEIEKPFEISSAIYTWNSVLCVLSLITIVLYALLVFYFSKKSKTIIINFFKRNWPLVLLAVFMIWTSVGCIQAGMEANAEAIIRVAEKEGNLNVVSDRIKEIAGWTSGDRMSNAADRSWNGCNNLKDGYFSFLFYATVMLNIFLLGVGSENYKKYIIRALTISSLFVAIITVFSLFRYSLFAGVTAFDKAIFNNRNHFGYYISVILIMSIVSFIKDKNLYFKGLAFVNTLLYIFLLFTCNTFGSYIGVFFGMAFLLIALLIRRKPLELGLYALCLIPFVFLSLTYVKTTCKIAQARYIVEVDGKQEVKSIIFDYACIFLNIGDSTYQLSFNSVGKAEAEALKLKENALKDGTQVYYGNDIHKLDNKSNSFVAYNFKKSFIDDLSKLFNFVKANSASGESSGEKNEQSEETVFVSDELSGEELLRYINNVLNEVAARHPKVSGETYEEWQAREEQINNELMEALAEKGITKKAVSKVEPNKEPINGDKVEANNNSEESSLVDYDDVGSGRFPVWVRSLDLMNQRPWFGWGLENMLNEFYQQYDISEGRTHNLVLQLGGTTGIPGVLMYLFAVTALWIKVLFDAKFRTFSKNKLLVILGVCLLTLILVNVFVCKITDKLFFNGLVSIIVLTILILAIFTKKVHLRIKEWNYFELISTTVFVSYMINSFFGNSAFYTSPYFMIFLGLLAFEAIYKTNKEEQEPAIQYSVTRVSKQETVAKEKMIEKANVEEPKKEEKQNVEKVTTNVKTTPNNNSNLSKKKKSTKKKK